MTIELLTKLVAVLVPLGTTVAAFIAAYASRTSARASRISASVAESQRELAERQYELQRRHQELEELRAKRELYERRLSVYQAVKVLLYNFDGLGGVSNQDANTFSQNTAEADFLFKGDEIPNYLKQMSINAKFLAFYREQLNDTYTLPDGEQRNDYAKREGELKAWFKEQENTAKEKLALRHH